MYFSAKSLLMDSFSNSMEEMEKCNVINAINLHATNANANGNPSMMGQLVPSLPAGRRKMTRTFRNADLANTWRTTELVPH